MTRAPNVAALAEALARTSDRRLEGPSRATGEQTLQADATVVHHHAMVRLECPPRDRRKHVELLDTGLHVLPEIDDRSARGRVDLPADLPDDVSIDVRFEAARRSVGDG